MKTSMLLQFSTSTGDLWSFNYYRNEFIVSPVPDIRVYKITPGMEKFLVIASDGLWGVMRVEEVVKFVHNFDKDDICNLGDVSHRYALANQALSTCFSMLGGRKVICTTTKSRYSRNAPCFVPKLLKC